MKLSLNKIKEHSIRTYAFNPHYIKFNYKQKKVSQLSKLESLTTSNLSNFLPKQLNNILKRIDIYGELVLRKTY